MPDIEDVVFLYIPFGIVGLLAGCINIAFIRDRENSFYIGCLMGTASKVGFALGILMHYPICYYMQKRGWSNCDFGQCGFFSSSRVLFIIRRSWS